ncbi:hypothetical protein Pcinc_038083 [Petrolisthes cinctipes]|uniref:Uncharacterized protein n=1 Tax=Petrolisthes cinctipes TaxID=88211 RepID=A0AAE1END5_PETCI|nr:hypothetical protein Pcinc_038083 [Petrolisthes cinctipes]
MFRKRRSFVDLLDNMEDTQPLLDESGDITQTERDVESATQDASVTPQHRDSGRSTPLPDHVSSQEDQKDLSAVIRLGFTFMLLFTAFNTNGIITVSIPFYFI